MPKELVYGSELPFGNEAGAVAVVETTWHRDAGHVQVATRCLDASTHEPYVPPPENTHWDGSQWAEGPPTAPAAGALPVSAGFYVNLDRKGINDMIRNLRRARDQAYGRDE